MDTLNNPVTPSLSRTQMLAPGYEMQLKKLLRLSGFNPEKKFEQPN